MSEPALISCRDLSPQSADTAADLRLDFDLKHGELVSIIGPDLEIRSLWLRTLCGLNDSYRGSVSLLGIDISDLSCDDWALTRRKVAYLKADTALISAANGLMNVLSPAFYHMYDRGGDKQLIAERALELLEEIDPDLNLDDLPAYISKQQCLKIATARALLLEPAALALDDPFIYFDLQERSQFQRYLNNKVDQGLAILLVTRDVRYALAHSDRIIYADRETLRLFDSVSELRHSDDRVITGYLQQYPGH